MSAVLHVSFLGAQAITDAATGRVLPLSSRAIELIAFLVVHAGSPQTRTHIAEQLWPNSTDAQALTNLRRELHHLRNVLGEEPSLVVGARDLAWIDSDTCTVDVRTFQRERQTALVAAAADDAAHGMDHASAAITSYAGDLLPGVFADWVLAVRTELERQCVDLCDLAGRWRSEKGDLDGAMEAVRRRIQLEPLEERGYRSLMELQSATGDRAGALSTYHHCASVLERELGVTPDESTHQALRRLMARGDASSGPPPAAEPVADRPGFGGVALVGRGRELAALQGRWEAASAGHSMVTLVRGGAGVGKTRLVTEVAERARLNGAVVATAQCFGTSGRLALAPVADWVRSRAVSLSTATLEPVWRVEVERLVPTGMGPGEFGIGARGMVDAWQRRRFFEGLARAFIGVGRPLLLVLDNVQWCDQETLLFITYLLRLPHRPPLLVAGTLRDDVFQDDPGMEVREWMVRMEAGGLLEELSLGPLNVAETARLGEAVGGRPLGTQDAELLQATTGGFPLYVIEAARSAAEPSGTQAPRGDMGEVLKHRLEQASEPAREIAGLAAAVGRDFSLDLLSEASDLAPDTVALAVDELWRRRIVQVAGNGYDFSHDLLREAAYEEVSPPRRWLFHRRVAQGLELLHPDDIDSVSAQLAEQYARGGQPARALPQYLMAAKVAASRFAHGEAIRLCKAALEIVRAQPRGRESASRELGILEQLAGALNARYGYAWPELALVLERAIALAESLGRTESTAKALVALWGVAVRRRTDCRLPPDRYQGLGPRRT